MIPLLEVLPVDMALMNQPIQTPYQPHIHHVAIHMVQAALVVQAAVVVVQAVVVILQANSIQNTILELQNLMVLATKQSAGITFLLIQHPRQHMRQCLETLRH